MSTITVDTFKFVDRLERAGASRELAAAMAEAQKEAFSEMLDANIATRSDLSSMKAELKADIASTRADVELMRKDLQALEMRLTIKLGAFLAAAVGIVIAVLRVA